MNTYRGLLGFFREEEREERGQKGVERRGMGNKGRWKGQKRQRQRGGDDDDEREKWGTTRGLLGFFREEEREERGQKGVERRGMGNKGRWKGQKRQRQRGGDDDDEREKWGTTR
ncbi:uncharacterized protein LOC132624776 [Lycium barbarum]|uniref:uncharacterized protein LOC132624776 n=1 Tax=Lycium barbarum TaxID=112863 RepID=UPI00293E244E|nr:uncharacterized protein LOC132624776 [Lycium barbarum]